MAEHIWTILCNKTLVDPNSQVISVIDVAESLSVVGLQQQIEDAILSGKRTAVISTAMQVVSWWFRSDRDEDELQARFILLSPDQKNLLTQPVNVPWGEDKLFSRIYLDFDKLPVSMPGLHWFAVEQQKPSKSGKSRWRVMTRIPLYINNF